MWRWYLYSQCDNETIVGFTAATTIFFSYYYLVILFAKALDKKKLSQLKYDLIRFEYRWMDHAFTNSSRRESFLCLKRKQMTNIHNPEFLFFFPTFSSAFFIFFASHSLFVDVLIEMICTAVWVKRACLHAMYWSRLIRRLFERMLCGKVQWMQKTRIHAWKEKKKRHFATLAHSRS